MLAFLDTPLEVCVNNVRRRRQGAGNDKEGRRLKIEEKFKCVQSVYARVTKEDKLGKVEISMSNGADVLLELLRK